MLIQRQAARVLLLDARDRLGAHGTVPSHPVDISSPPTTPPP
jgi:hypothetical protein